MTVPWTLGHELRIFAQHEARTGKDLWMEHRLTGNVAALCNCGYSTGWVQRDQLPTLDQLKADHPGTLDQVAPPTLIDDRTRIATIDWLRANNIDPADVPPGAPITIHTAADGARTIRYTRLLREDGHRYIDNSGQIAAEEREVPLLTDALQVS